jgi:hypothetical protein
LPHQAKVICNKEQKTVRKGWYVGITGDQ